MTQVQKFNQTLVPIVIIGDLIVMNVLFVLLYFLWTKNFDENVFDGTLSQILALFNLCYFACSASGGVVLHRRGVRADQVVHRCLRTLFFFILLSMGTFTFVELGEFSHRFFVTFFMLFAVFLCVHRLTFRSILQAYRRHGGNLRSVIFLGSSDNMMNLYQTMSGDITQGYRIRGYFDLKPNPVFPSQCPYLGKPEEAIGYMKQNNVEQLYCCLPSAMANCIVPVINYCENNLVHFYSVPNVSNYLHHRMHLGLMDNIPVLQLHNQPLERPENKLMKRAFDIVFSALFLCTLFPIILLVVFIVMKITMPGPIFFQQKRNGLNGKEFVCYKFRSMKVNDDADKVQATLDDPRKTKFGDIMRKTSIDELPQFFNVLRGDMSIVGPRPHMLKHTEEYSHLINKYMVRHFLKPGITGWAQVTGFRGETRELSQMEGRVKADIWYMENWTFLLDLYIIYKTVANAVKKDKQAY